MPVINLESPGSGLWTQMTWPQYPVIGLTHPCILRRDSCKALPHECRVPFPLLGRGNVGTPWWVRSKGAECTLSQTRSSATAEEQRVSCPHGGRRLGPPAHSPSAPSGYTYPYGRIRNQQQTYVKRAVRKAHFKMNQAFKVIQGHPYWCRQESRMVCCRNVQLMPTLFLKLTKIRQRENGKFVDFNDLT